MYISSLLEICVRLKTFHNFRKMLFTGQQHQPNNSIFPGTDGLSYKNYFFIIIGYHYIP